MPYPTAVINVVGLTTSILGDHTPHLLALAKAGSVRRLRLEFPAVTCSVQASMLTGLRPIRHGIVGNGWYDRDLSEVHFWKQSNRLVHGEKVWEAARVRDPSVTCANLFWWFNMYSSADVSVTPRPMYKADGRKIPDCHTRPADLRDRLQAELGAFPLFNFWGPGASIVSSRWIADAAMRVHTWHKPTLSLIYLPHLDYALQKLGPEHAGVKSAAAEIDGQVGRLLDYFNKHGVRVIVLSEYGIEPVTEAIPINRVLRQAGALKVRLEDGLEMLDAGASDAFAVADHQAAHVYVNDPAQVGHLAAMCASIKGVARVLDRKAQTEMELAHRRAGDLVLVAEPGHWFSYPWWLDDSRAPDFARTVDIHRKPGYDPLDLFINPKLTLPSLHIAFKLGLRKLGFRTLLDVIPLDTRLVRGSHGRVDMPLPLQPLLITRKPLEDPDEPVPCHRVHDVILDHLFRPEL
ncbi:MAG: alkaline phosphatase family protein [Planctomycetes bacterium]|nr:alkaline phosphatase family protein [Planctomycetota bacterium]